MRTEDMKDLIGKKILKLYVSSENQDFIKFVTDDKTYIYEAIGDCCSETWFADILGVDSLLNGVVMSVQDIELDSIEGDPRSRQDYDEIYSIKIVTDKGHADIIFRNSSNGYYTGWYFLCKKAPECEFTEITDDWSA